MLTDIEIAKQAKIQPIGNIAEKLGISADELEFYGKYKAKLAESLFTRLENRSDGKLVLVTAINPTPAGEGKTTTTIALGQALNRIGESAVIALREPSLGPVFGVKGGAAGGGYSQVVPMEDINLHFTGDMHAITAANNLLCAVIDNHLFQGNELALDIERIFVRRCLDMNDRALRHVTIGQGVKTCPKACFSSFDEKSQRVAHSGNSSTSDVPIKTSTGGIPRRESFLITVASEVMAILCLSENLQDLKQKLGNILVGYSVEDKPLFVRDFNVQGAMAALLKDAIKPNLVQTLENTPAIIHGGPFANIAHGCNSLRATKIALKLADYCVTEAGFGSDLGAEKFLDIKCRIGGLSPSAIVLVATVRALKYNGGVAKENLAEPNTEALQAGLCNLEAHIENMTDYGIPLLVSINRFPSDTDQELQVIIDFCKTKGVIAVVCEGFSKGGAGAVEVAKEVVALCKREAKFEPLYELDIPIDKKIAIIAAEIYGAGEVVFNEATLNMLSRIKELGFDNLPVCIAKTQYSLSDNPKLLGRPRGFPFHVRDIKISSGAGFIVVLAGDVMTMPGLPKIPAVQKIDIDAEGEITGLF